MTDLIDSPTLEESVIAFFTGIATMFLNAVIAMRWPVLTVSVLLNIAMAKPAYLQYRQYVIEWAVDQPEMDKIMVDKSQAEDLAAMKNASGTEALPVKSKK